MKQATGLVRRAPKHGTALPLRDSAGIAPDFADVHTTPVFRGANQLTASPGRTICVPTQTGAVSFATKSIRPTRPGNPV